MESAPTVFGYCLFGVFKGAGRRGRRPLRWNERLPPYTVGGIHECPVITNGLIKTNGGRGNPSPTINLFTSRLRWNKWLSPYSVGVGAFDDPCIGEGLGYTATVERTITAIPVGATNGRQFRSPICKKRTRLFVRFFFKLLF